MKNVSWTYYTVYNDYSYMTEKRFTNKKKAIKYFNKISKINYSPTLVKTTKEILI